MHADMEIQSAAMLPTRQVRRSIGTGARSALESGESLAMSASGIWGGYATKDAARNARDTARRGLPVPAPRAIVRA